MLVSTLLRLARPTLPLKREQNVGPDSESEADFSPAL